ncbi:baseplate J/gp47 family protein [Psychrobacillus sp.]|uniref:baseplate assembly protein n=1 Tax=Psychrobacillus sp. TaxID=1871623 RepID=UPI0028BE5C0E|nr:baseplate J/gp47 family protein [Psychrobacillus sp.]
MSLSDLPDIEFVETNPEVIIAEIVNDYQNAYFESTGTRKLLQPGDPIRIFLYTQALREIQLRHVINETAKQNSVKYAKGANLDLLGARMKTPRNKAKPARTRMLLKFSKAFSQIILIPQGNRFSPGSNVFFETETVNELQPGEQELVVNVIASDLGASGNNFLVGQINVIVDSMPFLIEASNLDVTQGGEDIEEDDPYRIRVYLAPEGMSVAGPESAYEYLVKGYSSSVIDARILNPADGVVDIRVILKNGDLPTTTFLDGLLKYLGKDKRPLTDKVQASAPDVVSYNVNVTYYVSGSDISKLATIQSNVQVAINEFILWQKSKTGRDINPSELIFKLRQAGAKRVEVISPSFQVLNENEVAHADQVSYIYGGLEDE